MFHHFRRLAASIKKPFELRYNPYTASVDALTTSGQIKDLAKELRGDMFLISNAMRKLQVLSTMKNIFQFQFNSPSKDNLFNEHLPFFSFLGPRWSRLRR